MYSYLKMQIWIQNYTFSTGLIILLNSFKFRFNFFIGRKNMIIKSNKSVLESARIKIISLGLILGVVFGFFSGYLSYKYMGNTQRQRLDSLKQIAQVARNSIEPILLEYRSQKLSKANTLEKIRDLVRRMVYNDHLGKNYIFMSAYDGTMLVQPFETKNEMSNMWDLKDFHGIYIIRALVDAAKSKNGYGYVTYHYKRPDQNKPKEKISFVIGIPELDCYIGTGQYMTDLRKNQMVYILSIVGLTFVLLILLSVLVRASMKVIRKQNVMFHKENESLKLAEEALSESEEKYRSLANNLNFGI